MPASVDEIRGAVICNATVEQDKVKTYLER